MNERIKQLRAKAQELAAEAVPGNVPFDPNPNLILWDRIHLSYEKFAELLVKECADYIDAFNRENMVDEGMGGAEIRKHFGIE